MFMIRMTTTQAIMEVAWIRTRTRNKDEMTTIKIWMRRKNGKKDDGWKIEKKNKE